jgi:hypothetical protein
MEEPLRGEAMKIRLAFFVVALAFGAFWGLVAAPWFVAQDSSNIDPLTLSACWYFGIFITSFFFVIAIVGPIHRALRISVAFFAIYLLIDWFEPPMVLKPRGGLTLAAGYKSSLDYVVGNIWHSLTGIPFEATTIGGFGTIYLLTTISVTLALILIILAVTTPQLLGKVVRRII